MPVTIIDGTCTGAVPDGAVEPEEYVLPVNPGVNDGFGDQIGAQSELRWDSSGITGELTFAVISSLQTGISTDVAVMYIDRDFGLPNGFDSTISFTDEADPERAAISGQAISTSDSSVIEFAANFRADYAIAFNQSSATLYKLGTPSDHTVVKSLTIGASGSLLEVGGFTMEDLSLTLSDSFAYVVTLINPDDASRANEFIGAAYSGSNPGIGSTVTLSANDYSTFMSFDPPDVTAVETSTAENAGSASAVAQLSAATDCATIISFGAVDGSAVAGSDFKNVQPANGQLVISAGDTEASITFDVIDDAIEEGDESFRFVFTGVVNGQLDPVFHYIPVVITDNDILPVASIEPSTVLEGTSELGFYARSINVTLNSPAMGTVTVNVVAETATADNVDFVPSSAPVPVVFLDGETSASFTVQINPDSTFEDDEYFTTRITSATGATFDPGSTQQDILNDDILPVLFINDASEAEGTNSTPDSRSLTVSFSLDHASENEISFTIASADGTATVADGDYTGFTPYTFTIPANSTTAAQTVNVFTDNKYELDETFTLVISDAVGVSFGNDSATVTLENDDPIPSISVLPSPVDVTEGTGGTPTPSDFIISLSNPSYLTVSFNFETFDGTATLADIDYLGTESDTYQIAPGDTQYVFGAPVVADAKHEDDETFGGRITAVTNATAPDGLPVESMQDILNDDAVPTVTISSHTASSEEGTPFPPAMPACTFQLDLTLTLSNPTEDVSDVTLTAVDGTATLADGDYRLPDGSTPPTSVVVFAAEQTEQLVALFSVCDDRLEADETFSIMLGSPTNLTLGATTSAVFTLVNDDFTIDMLTDSGFENDGSDPRQGLNKAWTLTNKTGDKVVCYAPDSTVPYDGLCDFEFKGSIGENSQLSQTITQTEIDTCPANELRTNFAVLLSGAAQGTADSKLSFKMLAWDANNKKTTLGKGPIAVSTGWTVWSSSAFLLSNYPTKLRVTLIHKSKKGKTRIDDVHLYCGDTDHFRSDPASALLPPPAAPGNFRGQN